MKNDKKKRSTKRQTSQYGDKETKSNKIAKDSDSCFESKTNDWRWYAANEQILRDTSSFAYGYPLGTKLRLGTRVQEMNGTSVVSNFDDITLPGVMALRWIPTVGWSDDVNSPVNVVSRNLYTYIRHMNSGAKNYDANDLMMYLLAYDSACSYLSYLKRLYGTLTMVSPVNRYYPRALVRAQKGNYDVLITQLADLRAYINMFALKLGAMCIPNHMAIFAKHKWMNEGLYLDSPDAKGQTYLFVPEGYHYFTLDADGAGMCKFKKFPDTDSDLVTLEDLARIGNEILDPILYNTGEEDFNIISGDILKAYGANNVYRAEGISETYTVLPVYDEVVLSQIHNATMYGFASDELSYEGQYDVVQSEDKRVIIARPHRRYSYDKFMNIPEARILSTKVTDPTPAFTMEATRLMTIPDFDNNNTMMEYRNVGSELLTRAFIYIYFPDAEGNLTIEQSSTEIQSNVTVVIPLDNMAEHVDAGATINSVHESLMLVSWLSNFDWHPIINYTVALMDDDRAMGSSVKPVTAFNGDINNYAIISKANQKMMSETALLSEFGIEQFGKSSK